MFYLAPTHTLDKNGSLYDPAGTESWNMQIRYETMKLTMHPTNNASNVYTGPGGVSSVATDPPGTPVAPCIEFNLELERERTKEEKERETVLHLFRCYTHTHTWPEPGQPWKARGRKKADTRRANGQKQRRGGRGTDGPPEPTYTAKRTWTKQRAHLNPTTHYGEARGEIRDQMGD